MEDRSIGQQLSGLATAGLAEINTSAVAQALLNEPPIWKAVRIASASAGAYHGTKRNDSVGWGVWWFFMGTFFPVITPVIAVAQGFGERKR